MKYAFFSSLAATAVLASALAHAETPNLLVCQDHGFVLQSCILDTRPLMQPIADDDGTTFETEYTVEYDFPCTGNPVHFGLRSGASFQPLVMGAHNGTVTGLVGGTEIQAYDPSPETTRRLSFRPGCSLNVTRVDALPSNGTVRLWTENAASEARILKLSLHLYELAQDYADLASWDRSKLTLLRDKLSTLVQSDPTNLHLKVMAETVENALNHAPPSYTTAEIATAGQSLQSALRSELDEEIKRAKKQAERFTKWQLAVEQSLADILATLPPYEESNR